MKDLLMVADSDHDANMLYVVGMFVLIDNSLQDDCQQGVEIYL